MPHITLPCSICGDRTDWECSSCRQPACFQCIEDWPSKSGKGSRGYWCLACKAGLRDAVRVKRAALPIVTRRFVCGTCGVEVARTEGKRFTQTQREGLSDAEKVRLLFFQHRRAADCPARGLSCDYQYRYPEDNEGEHDVTTT